MQVWPVSKTLKCFANSEVQFFRGELFCTLQNASDLFVKNDKKFCIFTLFKSVWISMTKWNVIILKESLKEGPPPLAFSLPCFSSANLWCHSDWLFKYFLPIRVLKNRMAERYPQILFIRLRQFIIRSYFKFIPYIRIIFFSLK